MMGLDRDFEKCWVRNDGFEERWGKVPVGAKLSDEMFNDYHYVYEIGPVAEREQGVVFFICCDTVYRCGSVGVRRYRMARHKKTLKHLKHLKDNPNVDDRLLWGEPDFDIVDTEVGLFARLVSWIRRERN